MEFVNWAAVRKHAGPNVAMAGMTMAADLLSGQKVGWSLLGGVISGVTAKDGWVSDKLGTAIESPSIANFMLGTAGAAATGATTAVATGASVTAGVSASVATSFKGSGPTLTTPPKQDGNSSTAAGNSSASVALGSQPTVNPNAATIIGAASTITTNH